MKIAILLPYKEDYTPKYSGAVSIHVSNLIKYSKYKNTTTVFGNTLKKNIYQKTFLILKLIKVYFLVIIKNIWKNLLKLIK